MATMTVEEFNSKYYIDYKAECENGLVVVDGNVTIGEGNLISLSDLFISDVNSGDVLYRAIQFDCLMEEVNKFCKENEITLTT